MIHLPQFNLLTAPNGLLAKSWVSSERSRPSRVKATLLFHLINLFCSKGGERIAHWKNLTFPNNKFGGAVRFLPRKMISFCRNKIRFVRIHKFNKGEPWRTGLEASPTNEKWKKSIIVWGGSGHPYFMNLFETGQSFLDQLFPKRIGALTQTKP